MNRKRKSSGEERGKLFITADALVVVGRRLDGEGGREGEKGKEGQERQGGVGREEGRRRKRREGRRREGGGVGREDCVTRVGKGGGGAVVWEKGCGGEG